MDELDFKIKLNRINDFIVELYRHYNWRDGALCENDIPYASEVGEYAESVYQYIELHSNSQATRYSLKCLDTNGWEDAPLDVSVSKSAQNVYQSLRQLKRFIPLILKQKSYIETLHAPVEKTDEFQIPYDGALIQQHPTKTTKYDEQKQDLCLIELIDEFFNTQLGSTDRGKYINQVQSIIDKVDCQIFLYKDSIGEVEYIDYLISNLPNHPKLNIYGQGSKFLDMSVVGNFYFGLDRLRAKLLSKTTEERIIPPIGIDSNVSPKDLPPEFDTDRARKYFARAVDGGLLTPKEWMPTQRATKGLLAIFATELGKKLNIIDFNAKCEQLWDMKHLAQAYQKVSSQKNFDRLETEIKQYFIVEE